MKKKPQIILTMHESHKEKAHNLLTYRQTCRQTVVTMTIIIIAAALVSSKLDYNCNSSLYKIPNREINKLQCGQNYCLARVVFRSPHYCSVTSLLESLHIASMFNAEKVEAIMHPHTKSNT